MRRRNPARKRNLKTKKMKGMTNQRKKRNHLKKRMRVRTREIQMTNPLRSPPKNL
jgi:protein subunit release factor B